MIKNQIKVLSVLLMVVSFLFVTTMPANAGGFFKRFKENYIVKLGGAKVHNPKAKVDTSKMYADAGNTASDAYGPQGLTRNQKWFIGGTLAVVLVGITLFALDEYMQSDNDPAMATYVPVVGGGSGGGGRGGGGGTK